MKLSIGIPAYNEEQNLRNLLPFLLHQKNREYVHEVIVASDGSSDKTALLSAFLKDTRLRIINGKTRKGKTYRMNQLLTTYTEDFLLFFDADITIQDRHFFHTLSHFLSTHPVDIAAIQAFPLPGRTLVERVINHSVDMQDTIRHTWNAGDNYLSFKGLALLVSRRVSTDLRLPSNLINNDAYVYFYAKSHGIRTTYISTVAVFYRSPSTLVDHLQQSSRFKTQIPELRAYFPDIEKQSSIPHFTFLRACLWSFIKNPLYFTLYCLFQLYGVFGREKHISSAWNVSLTTKALDI